jgi:hypothetical protein
VADAPALDSRIVEVRRVLADRLAASRNNAHSPVSANLLFRTPIGSVFEEMGSPQRLCAERVDCVRLTGDLVEVRPQLARAMVELLAGVRAEHEFFEELGLISAEHLPLFERILTGRKKTDVGGRCQKTKRFVSLVFKVVAA